MTIASGIARLAFTYFAEDGTVTWVTKDIRIIGVTVSAQSANKGAYVTMSDRIRLSESMSQVYEREVGMNRVFNWIRERARGVALPLAMILLMVLTLLTITFMSLGAVEPQISQNLSDGARARQARRIRPRLGDERPDRQPGPQQRHSAWVVTMTSGGACGTGNTRRVLATAQTLPGLTSSSGPSR